MPDTNPRNLRTVREIARRDILFSVARVPNSDRVSSSPAPSNKVYELDAGQANADAARARRPRPLRHRASGSPATSSISGGYDGRLIWWDLQNHRVDPHRRRAHAGRSASSPCRPTARSSPASPTTWSAGSGTSRPANACTNCAATRSGRRPTSARCSIAAPSPTTARSWRPATASATSSSGTSRRPAALDGRSAVALHLDPRRGHHPGR